MIMTVEYINTFTNLIQHKESEVVEFKKAENNFDFDDLGKYFSALSNEANLLGLDFAWLIFGYDEKKHEIVGTSYKNGEGAFNNIKHDFSQHTTDGQTFREIIPIEVEGKRILMFKIPASPRNIVMKWKGIAYGRDGESLKALNQSKRDAILEYLQGTLPGRNTREQNSDLIRNILREMGQENIIVSKNKLWYLSKSTD